MTVYPEIQWNDDKFRQLHSNVQYGYWSKVENQRAFMEQLGPKLGVVSLSDWNNITTSQIEKEGGTGLLKHFGGSLSKCTMVFNFSYYVSAIVYLSQPTMD
jgi:hypothetical protein